MNLNKETKIITINDKEVKIDNGCVKMVKLFNQIGLTTQFCCEGHKEGSEFYIVLDEKVPDNIVIDLIENCSNEEATLLYGSFKKWYRKCFGRMTVNWTYRVKDVILADMDYKIITDNITKDYKNIRFYKGNYAVRIMRRKKTETEAEELKSYIEQFMNCVKVYYDKTAKSYIVQTYKEFKNLNEAIQMRNTLEHILELRSN